MARIAVVFGGLMIALGVGGYFGAGGEWTMALIYAALIPILFGLVILALGLAALWDRWRQTAMHTAVVVGLVGFVLSVPGLVTLVQTILAHPSLVTSSLMAVLCGTFVVLSLKSFVAARRQPKAFTQSPTADTASPHAEDKGSGNAPPTSF